jgi:hypothetical protein
MGGCGTNGFGGMTGAVEAGGTTKGWGGLTGAGGTVKVFGTDGLIGKSAGGCRVCGIFICGLNGLGDVELGTFEGSGLF